jgi:hypothetical protein
MKPKFHDYFLSIVHPPLTHLMPSSVLYPCGVSAQGDSCTTTISDLLCVPIWFRIISYSSTRSIWQLPTDTFSSEAGETWRRNSRWILPAKFLFHTCRVLWHAVKSYDMGSNALLPLRKKSCYGFLSPLKVYRLRSGLNPRTLGAMASTVTTMTPSYSAVIVLQMTFRFRCRGCNFCLAAPSERGCQ